MDVLKSVGGWLFDTACIFAALLALSALTAFEVRRTVKRRGAWSVAALDRVLRSLDPLELTLPTTAKRTYHGIAVQVHAASGPDMDADARLNLLIATLRQQDVHGSVDADMETRLRSALIRQAGERA